MAQLADPNVVHVYDAGVQDGEPWVAVEYGGESLATMLRLAGPELRQRGRVEAVYSDVPPVRANAGRLGQVVLNLLMNAASALAARHGGSGSLRVETGQVGGRARVTVADDGPGVPAALRGRLFSAFARGREGEDSTGLGLYVSKHIVEEYGGTIRLDDGPHGDADVRSALRATEKPVAYSGAIGADAGLVPLILAQAAVQ